MAVPHCYGFCHQGCPTGCGCGGHGANTPCAPLG